MKTDDIKKLAEKWLKDMRVVRATTLGMPAIIGDVYVDNEMIAAGIDGAHLLDCYAGFSRVDPEFVLRLGDFVFYSCEDEIVADALRHLK